MLHFFKNVACFTALLAGLAATPASAKEADDALGLDGQVSLKLISTNSAQNGSDELDSSGFGARAELGYSAKTGDTEFRLEVDTSIYDYKEDLRQTRESYGARANLTQAVSKEVKLSAEARYAANIVTLESQSSDQTSARGEIAWASGKDTVTGYGEYRWRDYDDLIGSKGRGLRTGIEYRHRFGSWHWLRADVAHEDIASSNPLRGYKRDSASIDYSRPVAKNIRLVAGVEARQWTYDNRIAQGAPLGPRRKDSLIAPEIGLSYGRTKGIYANARASYQFRTSNDVRFGRNGPRLEVNVGYRF